MEDPLKRISHSFFTFYWCSCWKASSIKDEWLLLRECTTLWPLISPSWNNFQLLWKPHCSVRGKTRTSRFITSIVQTVCSLNAPPDLLDTYSGQKRSRRMSPRLESCSERWRWKDAARLCEMFIRGFLDVWQRDGWRLLATVCRVFADHIIFANPEKHVYYVIIIT